MGSLAALADESYTLPHRALFSTELLRDFFRRRGCGVYARRRGAGDDASVSFQNAITAVEPPTADELAARETPQAAVLRPPRGHAARNMFELGALALGRAARRGPARRLGAARDRHGSSARRRIGARRRAAPRPAAARGPGELRATCCATHDVGLALMYTPHPSLVPIEMASAGMLDRDQQLREQDARGDGAISSNLITVEPSDRRRSWPGCARRSARRATSSAACAAAG